MLIMLHLPGRADAAKPNDVLICTNYSTTAISCIQSDAQRQPFKQVIWAPQGTPPPSTGTPPARPSIKLSPGVKRLTLSGIQDLNGYGNGEANIIVGNTASNQLFTAGSGTYVIGNSSAASVTSLRSCRPSRTQDCLVAQTSGNTSENDEAELGDASTNAAVYINRTMEESGECIGPLYIWDPALQLSTRPDQPGGYALSAQTYGQGKVSSTGAWTDATSCTIP